MFDICIIDDELKAAEVVEVLLLLYFKNRISSISIYTDPILASAKINESTPDLIFLDIKMPGINGIEFLSIHKELDIDVIFVTAYDEYAIEALRNKAFDYLIKPIDDDDFKASFKRFLQKKIDEERIRHNKYLLDNKSFNFKIARLKSDKVYFQDVNSIVRCEAKSNYTYFHIENGTKLLSAKTLKQYDELLSQYFFVRIHKTHLINLQFAECLLKGGELQMKNGEILPIAKRRRNYVHQKIMKVLNINN